VGRTIRDRIEMERRVRAQSVEAQVSVVLVLLISYGITWIMWRANPEGLQAFLSSQTGSYVAAGAMALQAIGVKWIWQMSQVKY
jgi:Flp pilus assembly protein TadB